MGLFTKKVDSEPDQRDEFRRQQRERFATTSGWDEFRRADLEFGRFTITHQKTGDQYRLYRGEIQPAIGTSHPVSAYFHTESGSVEFLELVRKARR